MSELPAMLQPAAGFAGLPLVAGLDVAGADAVVMGIPHGTPYPHAGPTAGCAEAPSAIRACSQRLARFRGHHDFDLEGPMLPPGSATLIDVGDVAGSPNNGAGNAIAAESAVRRALAAGAVPIVLGGDDSVPIPVLRAYDGQPPITVVQVDAHLDFRDEVAGVRDGYSSPMRRGSEMAHVARIVQVGLRGVGSARASDVDDAVAAGNLLVTARELRERGVGSVLEQIATDASVFVSFDLDGLDPSVCPAVSAPSPGGLSYSEALALLRGIGPRLVGAVLTELVPALDVDGRSALVATRLAVALLATASVRAG